MEEHWVPELAIALRSELLALAHEEAGVPRGTGGLCTLASLALASLLRERGANVEVAFGQLDGEPHTWLYWSEDPALVVAAHRNRAVLLDVTADQFVGDAPQVASLPPGDAGRALYSAVAVGEEAEAELTEECPLDARDAAVLTGRVRRRLARDAASRIGVASAACPTPLS